MLDLKACRKHQFLTFHNSPIFESIIPPQCTTFNLTNATTRTIPRTEGTASVPAYATELSAETLRRCLSMISGLDGSEILRIIGVEIMAILDTRMTFSCGSDRIVFSFFSGLIRWVSNRHRPHLGGEGISNNAWDWSVRRGLFTLSSSATLHVSIAYLISHVKWLKIIKIKRIHYHP